MNFYCNRILNKSQIDYHIPNTKKGEKENGTIQTLQKATGIQVSSETPEIITSSIPFFYRRAFMSAQDSNNKKHSQFPMSSKFALQEWFCGSRTEAIVCIKIERLHFGVVKMVRRAETNTISSMMISRWSFVGSL